MEIVITLVIVGIAGYILFKNIKKKAAGKCDCCESGGDCSKCAAYRNNK